VSAVYAIVVALFIYREIVSGEFWDVVSSVGGPVRAGDDPLAGASVSAYILTSERSTIILNGGRSSSGRSQFTRSSCSSISRFSSPRDADRRCSII